MGLNKLISIPELIKLINNPIIIGLYNTFDFVKRVEVYQHHVDVKCSKGLYKLNAHTRRGFYVDDYGYDLRKFESGSETDFLYQCTRMFPKLQSIRYDEVKKTYVLRFYGFVNDKGSLNIDAWEMYKFLYNKYDKKEFRLYLTDGNKRTLNKETEYE